LFFANALVHVKASIPALRVLYERPRGDEKENGTFMGVKRVQYGKKGSGIASRIVDANVYNLTINNQTYYYWETTSGQFISSGLKK